MWAGGLSISFGSFGWLQLSAASLPGSSTPESLKFAHLCRLALRNRSQRSLHNSGDGGATVVSRAVSPSTKGPTTLRSDYSASTAPLPTPTAVECGSWPLLSLRLARWPLGIQRAPRANSRTKRQQTSTLHSLDGRGTCLEWRICPALCRGPAPPLPQPAPHPAETPC